MKTQVSPLHHKRAFTYATVIVSSIVIGATLAAYLKLVASQNQLTMRSQTWNRSVAVVEAGIEEALAHLNKNASADANGVFNLSLTADGWQPNASGGWFKTNTIGEDFYRVTITQFVAGDYYPNIISEAYVKQVPTFASRVVGPFLAQLPLPGLNTGSSTYVKRDVVCTTTNVPTFSKALVARLNIDLAGMNVRTDSFDSSDSRYSTDNRYDPLKKRANGDIASNMSLTNSVSVGNANVMGRVSTGAKGTIAIGSQGMVGDLAWHSNPNNRGKIQPGWSTDDMNMEFPEVIPPFTVGLPPERDKDKDGIRYDFVFTGPETGEPLNYVTDQLRGSILVIGSVQILVTSTIDLKGVNDVIKIETNGCLRLFADCTSANISGNGVQNPGISTNFYYFGTSKNTSLQYGGNSAFTGVFYAPNANLSMGGGGSSQIDFSGAAIARSIKMNGNYTFHYDEALRRVGLYRGYVVTSWNER